MCINEFIYLSVYDHIMLGEIAMFLDAFGQALSYHPNVKNSIGGGIYGCWITDPVSANYTSSHLLPCSGVAWCDMPSSLWKDSPEWLICLASETVNSMVKRRFGARMKKDSTHGRKPKHGWGFNVYNIERVNYRGIMEGVTHHHRCG